MIMLVMRVQSTMRIFLRSRDNDDSRKLSSLATFTVTTIINW